MSGPDYLTFRVLWRVAMGAGGCHKVSAPVRLLAAVGTPQAVVLRVTRARLLAEMDANGWRHQAATILPDPEIELRPASESGPSTPVLG